MNQDSFSKADMTRAEAADTINDPLALVQLLSAEQARGEFQRSCRMS